MTAAKEAGRADLLASAVLGLQGPPEFMRVGRDVVIPIREALEVLDPAIQPAQLAMLLARAELAIGKPTAFSGEPPEFQAHVVRIYEIARMHTPALDLGEAALDLARASGDSSVISSVLRARLRTRIERVGRGSDEVNAWIEELIEIGTRDGDKELLAWAVEWQAEACFEVGEVDRGSELMARFEVLANELKQPFHIWGIGLHRARMFIRKGDWVAAEAAALDSLSYAQRVNIPSAIWPFAIALFVIRKDQGRLAELEPWLKSFVEQFPTYQLVTGALALTLVDMDRHDEAAALALPLAKDLELIERDQFRPVTMGMLAEIPAVHDDASAARNLYEALLPWHDRQYMVAAGAVYGSASRHLGILAAALKLYDAAETHFEEALQMNRKMQAQPWIARTQLDYARMRRRREAAGDGERARQLLASALGTAREIGMANVAADCEELLARLPA
jgi:tetratricopeptide (TPR) repeat protein